ncbi:hypothetical protein OBBRIDRAFT_599230 [Obba rivulosa]|uniref:Uncharacterized protein n=1 Tax=Obba rivulosa TaxID=1052685 RepID=A0A8E2DKG5_9APHY|nr:hypothetical protein OBBRIDRAFT_599230 [Obba rivulosa]
MSPTMSLHPPCLTSSEIPTSPCTSLSPHITSREALSSPMITRNTHCHSSVPGLPLRSADGIPVSRTSTTPIALDDVPAQSSPPGIADQTTSPSTSASSLRPASSKSPNPAASSRILHRHSNIPGLPSKPLDQMPASRPSASTEAHPMAQPEDSRSRRRHPARGAFPLLTHAMNDASGVNRRSLRSRPRSPSLGESARSSI